ncbi:MAG: ZIP family metal transporter [Candidatus Diapherotrites archaeon]|nr:ZIP family metal transporter [Candidatus Diapherotrites archaeon]
MAVDLVLLFGSVFLVSIVSLIGAITLSIKVDLLKQILPLFVAFSAGALFGDVFIHLLPEAVEEAGFSVEISITILFGIVIFFLVEKIIHYHHKHSSNLQHHIHSDQEQHSEKETHTFTYMSLIGDGVHNFIDGLLIGGSYFVSIPLGISTTIAVILHEIPQEIADFGVLLHGGFSVKKALFFNFLSGITAILGVIIALAAESFIPNITHLLVPLTAGGFIYIAGSDLIPELHKETRIIESLKQLFMFSIGILVMLWLLKLEAGA